MRIGLTIVDGSAATDVVVTLEPGTTVAALTAAIATAVPPPAGTGSDLWLGDRAVDPAADVAGAGVRDGARLVRGAPGGRPDDVGSRLHLRVVGGPDAGTVHPLAEGVTTIGRSPECDVYLADRDVSRRHAQLTVAGGVVTVTDLDSSNGTYLDGTAVLEPTPVDPGALLEIGQEVLEVSTGSPADAAIVPGDEGRLDYSRPPRLLAAPRQVSFDLPAEPVAPERRAWPVLAAVIPLAMGAGMYFAFKSAYLLIFMLLSPVMVVASVFSERRSGRKSFGKRKREYADKLAETQARIAAALAVETRERRQAAPDAASVRLWATGPRSRLWERRRADDDSLLLRLGLATLPASVRLEAPVGRDTAEQPTLADVPATVPLREVGVLGVAGPRPLGRALGRWLVAQTAALSSPRDVGLVLLCAEGRDAGTEWDFFRWLPHGRATDADVPSAVGADPDSVAQRLAELTALVAARTRAAQEVRGRLSLSTLPAVVLVLDGAHALRALPGMPEVLQDGPEVGLYAICLEAEERLLPEECQAVAAFAADGSPRLTLRRTGGADVPDVRADLVTPAWAEETARGIAPLRDVSREDGESSLPTSLRLLDLLSMQRPTADDVAARWRLGGRSTAAVVGVSADGPFTLDLSRDGPHALVAGTTGAGKSEFLQTLIAALAVANRPDQLSFVLIDYKGGSAFKDCARLPHTVGTVTDLDGHLTERALTSLGAELKRRETLLGAAGAKDIEDYWDAEEAAGQPTLPRLVLVIDEFATLVEELPDFVRGLVGIAQRGRSLGVHLVLATQRPSGVVSPEIRANTNLRVALRVTDAAESTDVIDAPDAARVARATPGRGYARTGHASLTAFQSARIGGRRPELVSAGEIDVVEVPWLRLGAPLPRPRRDVVPDDDQTDLHLLVEAVRAAATREGVPAQPSPWLPPLPEVLDVGALSASTHPSPGSSTLPAAPDVRADSPAALAAVPYAVADLPASQSRRSVTLDLDHGGHLLVVGSARTGRSTALRTLAAGLAAHDPADVHVYALDCGNGALLPVADLPHCGAVVTRLETERADRLLSRLAAELTRRQQLLAAGGFSDVAEQRAAASEPTDRLPYLVLLLDRWEGFIGSLDDVDDGRLTDLVLRLLREGPAAGLRAVVTGDRTALMGKIAAAVEDKLVLRLADRSDYALAGLNPRTLPASIPPGRAFRGDDGLEVQFAILGSDPSGPGQVAAFAAVAAAARPASEGLRPFRVDVLPTHITFAAAIALAKPAGRGALSALVGVGGDELAACYVDLEVSGPGFTIGGPQRSGRSTALLTIATSLLAGGTRVGVLAPRPSPLRDLLGRPGVVGVVTSSDPGEEAIDELVAGVDGPLALVVDDAELLHPADAQPALVELFRTARDRTRAIIVAGTTDELIGAFRGFTVEARKSRSGLLLSPQSHQQGELLGVRLPRSAAFHGPPGRGLLIQGGQATLVQVPVPPA